MGNKVTIALDAFGGDNAPLEIVKGAAEYAGTDPGSHIILVGKKDVLNDILKENDIGLSNLSVYNADDVIETTEHPVKAIRAKKDSSMVKALELVKHGEADAMLSAGNSGALLVGAQTIVGRIRGVDRACLAPIVPTLKGPAVIVDGGANVDARAEWLRQWAIMGSVYMEKMFSINSPAVGIINIGAEEEKGNKLVQDTFALLKEEKDLNFIGSVEARDIPESQADVMVCDAFVGNVVLKMYEGVAKTLVSEIKKAIMSGTASKIGGMLIKKSLKGVLSTYNPAKYGGATLLGTKSPVVKGHGNSEAEQIKIALEHTATTVRKNIVANIAENIDIAE